MKTFYAEVHVGNTNTERFFELQAHDLVEAIHLMGMFAAGAQFANNTVIDLRGISQAKKRGTKYEVLS